MRRRSFPSLSLTLVLQASWGQAGGLGLSAVPATSVVFLFSNLQPRLGAAPGWDKGPVPHGPPGCSFSACASPSPRFTQRAQLELTGATRSWLSLSFSTFSLSVSLILAGTCSGPALPCLSPKASPEEPSSSPCIGSSRRYQALHVMLWLTLQSWPFLWGPSGGVRRDLPRTTGRGVLGGQRPQQPLHTAAGLICVPPVTCASSNTPGWCLHPNISERMGHR